MTESGDHISNVFPPLTDLIFTYTQLLSRNLGDTKHVIWCMTVTGPPCENTVLLNGAGKMNYCCWVSDFRQRQQTEAALKYSYSLSSQYGTLANTSEQPSGSGLDETALKEQFSQIWTCTLLFLESTKGEFWIATVLYLMRVERCSRMTNKAA